MSSIKTDLTELLLGEVSDAIDERTKYSRDTSLFSRTPSVVVYPKNVDDVATLVGYVHAQKAQGVDVSVTARSAGTDMSGGPLTTSIVAVFTKYINQVIEVGAGTDETSCYAITEPGVYYRDFEKETLKKNLLLPSYPASREICAMGGIVNNNSGGELTLEWGKTEKYVDEIEVILSDGSKTTLKELTSDELAEKKKLQTLEGEIYRRMHALIMTHLDEIDAARPHVSKNSAGYFLWNVYDKEKNTFNLAKLICGAQGTLALMTKAKLRLIHPQPNKAMTVVFLNDLAILPEIVHRVLKFNPESFESYDDHTFKLAIRFLPQLLRQMGLRRAIRLGISFLPEVGLVVKGGVPKLVLMAEFSEDTQEEAIKKAHAAAAALQDLAVQTRINETPTQSEKYWIVRRESFALLRKNLHGFYASPFIDDFVVDPNVYPQFLPELNALLDEYHLIYTIAGHVGNGNFHIIPLMDLKDPKTKQIILELSTKVYNLVDKYDGSITGEHNDGIIRTPYLRHMYGDKIISLFEETKRIFDPLNIFNPGKKVGGTIQDIERDMLKS